MVSHGLRALWDEPRPAHPPIRVWRDWVVVGVVLVGSVVEVLLREDRSWWPLILAVSLVIAGSLLWRRTRPLATMVAAFGTLLAFDLARVVAIDATGLVTIGASLVLAYALLRWGSGREVVAGLTILLVWLGVTHLADPTGAAEVVAGYAFFLFSAALGASLRFHAQQRQRAVEQATLRQRHELARDLHDTVGHHVSGIAIQAQAGRALAATDPERALTVLGTIEDAATRALEEMRAIVGVLRDDGEAERSPQPGVRDLEGLAGADGTPRVEVQLRGAIDELSATTAVAVYRIAQEAVTNAQRHARNASRVAIEVAAEDGQVRLSVRDDGEPAGFDGRSTGFGLAGMRERASLLGGTVDAGPAAEGGWIVSASLPTGAPRLARPDVADGPV